MDEQHVAKNLAKFGEANLSPANILGTQRTVFGQLGVVGAVQRTAANDFILLGQPFEEGGKFYSKIFNHEVYGGAEPPTQGSFGARDTCARVRHNVVNGVPWAWEHEGDDEGGVRHFYAGIAAEAKDRRVLFNVHWQDGWASLFHEPTHEAAPMGGGIGTAPLWCYEGYCEIFAAKIAQLCGVDYTAYANDLYSPFATEVKKLIAFTSEEFFARAYFTNDDWAYNLLCPLFYKTVRGPAFNLEPAIPQQYVLSGVASQVPAPIKELVQKVARPMDIPDWYRRWVRLYGRGALMPAVPAAPGLAQPGAQHHPPPPPPMMGAKFGAPPSPPAAFAPPPPPGGANVGGLPPASFTGVNPPTGWAGLK